MAKPTTTSTTSMMLFKCPACGTDVFGTVQVKMDFELGALDETGSSYPVTATGHVSGVRIEHNCIPRVTRGTTSNVRSS